MDTVIKLSCPWTKNLDLYSKCPLQTAGKGSVMTESSSTQGK